jgi:hypothetical protein
VSNLKPTIPPVLEDLSPQEIYILVKGQIPFDLILGFHSGRFKPNQKHRQILTVASLKFYPKSKESIRIYLQRRKYRAVHQFISFSEKSDLLRQTDSRTYESKLNNLVAAHWDEIVTEIARGS